MLYEVITRVVRGYLGVALEQVDEPDAAVDALVAGAGAGRVGAAARITSYNVCYTKLLRAVRAERNSGSDSVSLSSEAVEKAELFKALELAKAAPEIRMDRVAELKAKIDDPDYLNDAILNATADRILDQLL